MDMIEIFVVVGEKVVVYVVEDYCEIEGVNMCVEFV